MRKGILLALAMVAIGICLAGLQVIAQDTKPAAPAKLEAVKEPSKQWLEDYEAFLVLQRVISEMKKETGIDKLEERLNQKGLALQSGVPAGYNFDQNKKQFVIAVKPEPAKK